MAEEKPLSVPVVVESAVEGKEPPAPPRDFQHLNGTAPQNPSPIGAPPRDFQRLGDARGPQSGSIVDSLLGKDSEQAEAPSVVDGLLGTTPQTPPLELSAQYGLQKTPEEATRILKARNETGLPEDLIGRNLEDIEKKSKLASFEKLKEQSPFLTEWLSENPNHVAVAQKELPQLSYMERQWGYLQQQKEHGDYTVELGEIGVADILGTATPEQLSRVSEIESKMADKQDFGIEGYFEQIPGAVANQVPIYLKTLKEGAKGIALGGVGGGIGGLASGLMTGPGVVATTTAGVVAGIGIGFRAELGITAGMMEAGNADIEFKKIKGEDGVPIDAATAKGAAVIVGIANGTLESFALSKIASNVPGLRALTRQGVKQLLSQPSTRALFMRYAKNIGETMLTEGATEGLQEIVLKTMGGIAKAVTDGNLNNLTWENALQVLSDSWDSARAGSQAGGGSAVTGSAASVPFDMRKLKQAEQRKNVLIAIGEGAKESKVFQELPQEAQKFVEKKVANGPIKNIRIQVKDWVEYWTKKEVDPGEVAAQVIGDRTAYDEAVQHGGELEIPTARYAVTLAGTEHNAALADVAILSNDPNELSAKEAKVVQEELVKAMQQEVKAASNETDTPEVQAEDALAGDVERQLLDAGYDPADARFSAQISRAITVASKRLGIDPVAFTERVRAKLSIKAQEPGQTDEGGTEFNQADIRKTPSVVTWEAVPSASLKHPILSASSDKKNTIYAEQKAGLLPEWVATEGLKAPKEFFQSTTVSPIGFYSAVEKAVADIDFKDMPAKDLANRISNMQGLKAAELENLGLVPWLQSLATATEEGKTSDNGRVTKEQVLNFIKQNGLQLQQVVYADSYESQERDDDDDSDLPTPQTLDWQDPVGEVRDGVVGNEYEYYADGDYEVEDSFEDEWKAYAEANKEAYDAAFGKDGNYSAKRDYRRDFIEAHQNVQNYLWERAQESAQEEHNLLYTVTERETGWTLEGNDEYGDWYSPDIGDSLSGNLEEAKLKLIPYMIREGVVQGRVSDLVTRDQIEFDVSGKEPADSTIEKKTKALFKAEKKRLMAASKADTEWWGDEKPTKEQIEGHALRMARSEIKRGYEDPTNKRNEITIALRHPLLKGYKIVGNMPKGFRLLKGDNVLYEGFAGRTLEEIQTEALDWLKSNKVIETSEETGDTGSTEVQGPVNPNEPTKEAKFSSSTVPQGENYREFILTVPNNAGGNFTVTAHWGGLKNPLVHIRVTDRIIDGKRTLVVEEVQSDWTQQGREEGFKGEFNLPAGLEVIEVTKENEGQYVDPTDLEVIKAGNFVVFNPTNETIQFYGDKKALQEEFSSRTGIAVPPMKSTDAVLGLAMKRMIHLAVQEGYESVAWFAGETHADRWGTDVVSWVKKTADQPQFQIYLSGKPTKGLYATKQEAQAELKQRYSPSSVSGVAIKEVPAGPYWLMGAVDQRGGRAQGVDIEAEARARGLQLEKSGERVTSKEELRRLLKGVLSRNHGERSLESLTNQIWDEMQVKDNHVRRPREEGLKYVYDTILTKKVVPPILKKLDKSVTVKPIEVDAGEVDHSHAWVGPTYTPDELLAFIDTNPKGLDKYDLKDVQNIADDMVNHGLPFEELAAYSLPSNVAEALGGEVRRIEKKLPRAAYKFDLTEELKAKAAEGFTLYQKDGEGKDIKRASVTFGSAETLIKLGKNKNLSSLLHEFGHVYLEILGDLADADAGLNLSTGVKGPLAKDYDVVLKWLGVSSREEITTAHHEKFAQGFETYLMEGKAPSVALKEAFARFRAWLLDIYKNGGLDDVGLTPEMRGVFDRLLATEEEIAAAQAEQNMKPMFPELHTQAYEDAKLEAEGELAQKIMREEQRKKDKSYQARREVVRAEVAAEVSQRKEQVALAVLTRGTQPDGSALPETGTGKAKAFKLSKDAIVKQFGKERLATLPRPYVYSKTGGMHHDAAADIFGFSSGDELLTAITKAEKFEDVVEKLTDERMDKEYGDLMSDGTMPMEAMKAVHNEKRSQLLMAELKALIDGNFGTFKSLAKRVARRLPPIEMVREQAQEIIRTKLVRDLRPSTYQLAEKRAAKEAMDLFLKGEMDLAFDAKMKELLNHELYRAATAAIERADKNVEFMQKFQKASVREKLAKAGADYLHQIDTLLERFSFKAASLKKIDARKSLLAWMQEQQEAGYTVDLPEKLLQEANRKHYKDMTSEELEELRDSIETIAHLATVKNKLLANKEARDLEEAAEEIVASIGAHHDMTAKPKDLAPSLSDAALDIAANLTATHTRMEFFFEWLDGYKNLGPVWRILFKPFSDAESRENEMLKEVTTNLKRIFHGTGKMVDALTDRTFYPQLGTHLTKAQVLVIALNQGNEYNRQALMEGEKWTEAQVDSALDTLTKEDWDKVQAVWNYIQTFWPAIKAMEERLNGLPPEQVRATQVKTKFGVYQGGYYPVVFDSKRSTKADVREEKKAVTEMFGGQHAKAMTRHGHTKERTATGGQPLSFDLSGLTTHLANVVHDLTHREAVIDAHNLINHPKVRAAITQAAGRHAYKQLNTWLKRIAGDRPVESVMWLERMVGRARSGATVANMGWKMTTAFVQMSGYLMSTKELGPKYAALGLKEMFKGPKGIQEKWDLVISKSAVMRDRIQSHDRDVRDTLRKIEVEGNKGPIGKYLPTLPEKAAYFALIGYMDMAVSMPTWLGAYHKAMDGKAEGVAKNDDAAAVDFADKTVRQTQGAGGAKDLSGVQGGTEFVKMFSMFYSFFSVLHNQLTKTKRQYQMDRDMPKLIGSLMLTWFIPAVLDDLLLGRGPDDDDDLETWLKWIVAKEISYPFQGVILARDIVNGIFSKYGYSASPALEALEELSDSGRRVLDGEVTGKDLKSVFMTVGYFAALPARQVWLTGEYLYDWVSGEHTPDNPAQGLWEGLVTGRPKKK